jgi:flagellin
VIVSSIVLSASVRQNLLSLQSTASLLATTQNDLATGNKVNSALDNPTSFFTASALNNRASDISNLLDGIGNGVQVLQAANTGITSLQSLVASAQSVANQVLQTPIGYTAKSSVSAQAITGATASDLLGGSPATNAVLTGASAITTISLADTPATNAVAAAGAALTSINLNDTPAGNATETGTNTIATSGSGIDATGGLSFDINGHTVTLTAGGGTGTTGTYLASDIVSQINTQVGASAQVQASVDVAGHLTLTSTGTAGASDAIALSAFTGTGFDGTSLGFSSATPATVHGTAVVPHANLSFQVNGQTVTLAHGSTYTGTDIATAIQTQVGTSAGVTASYASGKLVVTSTATPGSTDTVAINNFSTGGATQLGYSGAAETDNGNNIVAHANLTFKVNNQTVTLAHGASYTGAQIADAIQTQVGTSAGVTASYTGGKLSITSTGTAGASDAVTVDTFSAGDASQLGFAVGASATASGAAATSGLAGKTLTIAATGGGTATNLTFGTAGGQVESLNDLNAALAANNLQATIDTTGVLTITTSNNAASSTIGTIGGTAAATGQVFNGLSGAAAVGDPNALATRSGLVDQYNNILKQIDTTAQDSSFNGINLLEGDTLNLTFDETGKSTLAIKGVTFNTAGLGLSTLSNTTDFLDSNSANRVLASLTQINTTLRSEASSLGSNLSIVQIRQDFSKNLINVLQTGASNLTLADTNEEAANSQALSTRQSIAVSALALANQSQQSVLQLLR